MTSQTESAPRVRASTLVLLGLVAAAVLWSYWTTLAGIMDRWSSDPQYSHGYLVPLFSAYLLWMGRDRLLSGDWNTNWLGLVLLALAGGLRLAGARFHFEYLDQISLLPSCAGLALLAGSWAGLRWALPAVGFLIFMVPLPHTVSLAMSGPMQLLATVSSTFVLQVLGRPALAEGNVILLNDIELGIVEACSGLRMLVVFFALSTAVALLVRKPVWEKLLIAGSAVPIALVSNILRIVITGLCYEGFGDHFGGQLFHDIAGWLMMPLGLAFLGIEMWILRTLLIERPADEVLATQVTLQRVEVNPVTIYGAEPKPRREKTPEPVAVGAEEVEK